jgi:hypothetical protein
MRRSVNYAYLTGIWLLWLFDVERIRPNRPVESTRLELGFYGLQIPLQRKIYGGDLGPDLLIFFDEEMTTKSETSSITGPLTLMISLQSQISMRGQAIAVSPSLRKPFQLTYSCYIEPSRALPHHELVNSFEKGRSSSV